MESLSLGMLKDVEDELQRKVKVSVLGQPKSLLH